MLTTHVSDAIFAICSLSNLRHGLLIVRVTWPCEPCLHELAPEHLDKAVSVGVVMDAAAVALTPTQNHQVVLPIALVNQIASIPGKNRIKYIYLLITSPYVNLLIVVTIRFF